MTKTKKRRKAAPVLRGRPQKYVEPLAKFDVRLTTSVREALEEEWAAEAESREGQFSRADLVLEILADYLGVSLERSPN